jgi:hypothetical protein
VKNLLPRILRRGARKQPSAAHADDLAYALLRLVNAAIADGDAYFIGETAELPEDPAGLGCGVTPPRTPRNVGRCIGAAADAIGPAGRRVNLFPIAAYTAAEDAAARRGVTIPMSHPQATAALAARHLVIVDPWDDGPVRGRLRIITGRVWDVAAYISVVKPYQDAISPTRTQPSDSEGH